MSATALGEAEVPTLEELRERVRRIRSRFEANAEQCESDRSVPEENIRLLRESGLFDVLKPRAFGGYEMDLGDYVELCYEVAQGCTATGWVYAVLACHSLLAGGFPEQVQRELWVDREDTLVATGWAPRRGHALKTEGGYVCNGQWGAASGIQHAGADLLQIPVIDPDDGALVEMRMFLLYRDLGEYEIVDTWHSDGLKGTGSHDVRVADQLFVPEYRTLAWAELCRQPDYPSGHQPKQGAGVHDSIWYRVPADDWMTWTLVPALSGGAQAALDSMVQRLQTRTNLFRERLAETQSVQQRIADAQCKIDLAMVSIRHDVAECRSWCERDEPAPLRTRLRWRANTAQQGRLLIDAMTSLRYRDGFSGSFLREKVQRAHRDVTTGTTHVGFDWDVMGRAYGRHLLGVDDDDESLASQRSSAASKRIGQG